MQPTSNNMGWDLENRQCVPTHPSPDVAPDFAHHDTEVLHCHGAKWHHAQAVMVVYGEEPASPYPARVRNNIGHWPLYQLAWDGHAQVHCSWRTEVHDLSIRTETCSFLPHAIWMCHSAFLHFSWGSNECVHDTSTHKMWSKNALPSFLQLYRWLVVRTCTAPWSSLRMCGIHFSQTVPFPKLLLRVR